MSEEEHERIFQQDVKPYLMTTASSELHAAEKPTMVIVGGQPGAGKSRSIDSVRQDLEHQGGVIEIAADDLRKFHPKNDELMQKDDKTAADFTHADASAWAEKAERFACEQKYNVLLEGTMKTPENAAAKMAEYKAEGYFVEARVIAVHERTSWQGVIGRYEQQKADFGTGRDTPKHVHDAAVTGVLATVDKLENDKLVDRIRIDRRGAEQIYSNTRQTNGEWEHPPGARQAIQAERDKPLTAQQWDTHVAGYDRIATLQDRYGRSATGAEVLQVQQLRADAAVERDRAALRKRDTEAARSFQKDTPEVAMAKHPRLAGAYAVMHTIDTQAKEHGMDAAQRQIVMARTREQLGYSIGGGSYPEMRVRAQVQVQAEPKPQQQERER